MEKYNDDLFKDVNINTAKDVNINTDEDVNINAAKDVNINAAEDVNCDVDIDYGLKNKLKTKSIIPRNNNKYMRKPKKNIKLMSFQKYSKIIGIKIYATKNIWEEINKIWIKVQREMLKNNIWITQYNELYDYLKNKEKTSDISKVYMYNYIINVLNEYKYYYNQFTSNYKNLIYRLKNFATIKKYKNINEIKFNLDRRLYKFVREDNSNGDNSNGDNSNKKPVNDYKLESWLIIARYMCDFIEDNMAFDIELGIQPTNPIFPVN
jgi:hypothetical protein